MENYDLVVVEATPAGIAMAVRAAREGLRVLLTNRHQHLGGILSSGLGVWDTLYEGRRSPIYDEIRQAIFDYYLHTHGPESPEYLSCLPGKTGHNNGTFEPHVAEKILTDIVSAEKTISVLRGVVPHQVEQKGGLITSVIFRTSDGDERTIAHAGAYADCSYEGDLAALAGVPYRIGREARSEFNEPHAGRIFMRNVPEASDARREALGRVHDTLNLRLFGAWSEMLEKESTGQADHCVQAFNYRTTLSSDPANRLPATKPDAYDPASLAQLEYVQTLTLPNQKTGWNRPQLIGLHQDYIEADWHKRQEIMDRHWEAMLGLLYFLQNDPSVPPEVRERWKSYGLAKDEYGDNGHRPYEFYVREARRIVGRYIFSEHDVSLAAGLERAPIHPDSIGITEWYLDSHVCVKGSGSDGKMTLYYETFPAQLPYRCLLSPQLNNLLVPVCLSATHVGLQAIRLEPTWIHLAESAAYAVVQAARDGTTPAEIDVEKLLQTLARNHVMISFFNDTDVSANDPQVAAAQYFATKGFFHDYNARLDEPLKKATGVLWTKNFLAGGPDIAIAIATAEASEDLLTRKEFAALLPFPDDAFSESAAPLTRGEALARLLTLRENSA